MRSRYPLFAALVAGAIAPPVFAQHYTAEIIIAPLGNPQQGLSQNTDLSMLPSVLSSTLSPYGAGVQRLELTSACTLMPEGTIIPNCDITIAWSARNGSGGHVHNTNRPPGIFKTQNDVTAGSTDPGPPGSITDNSGLSGTLGLTYTSPEASGIIDGVVTGVGIVNGSTVQFGPTPFTIGVEIDDLTLANVAGLQVETASNMHGNNNGNGSQATNTALGTMAQNFANELTRQGLPVPVVRLTAMTLPFGGLFDFRTQWHPPHASHRFGNDVDVGIRELTRAQRRALVSALNGAGFTTPVRAESSTNPNASHWHLRLP